jgi:hypothetical protein
LRAPPKFHILRAAFRPASLGAVTLRAVRESSMTETITLPDWAIKTLRKKSTITVIAGKARALCAAISVFLTEKRKFFVVNQGE